MQPLRFAFARSWGDVAQDTANGPVSQAALAEVPRLLYVTIVVVTELQTPGTSDLVHLLLDQVKTGDMCLALIPPHDTLTSATHKSLIFLRLQFEAAALAALKHLAETSPKDQQISNTVAAVSGANLSVVTVTARAGCLALGSVGFSFAAAFRCLGFVCLRQRIGIGRFFFFILRLDLTIAEWHKVAIICAALLPDRHTA